MISIISPTFNRAFLLPRMLESVLCQTYSLWELIIMDDGSTDNTRQVVQSYSDPRIKYFNSNHSGAAQQRNIGVKKSLYEYIIFLDSDDEPKPEWLEVLIKEIDKDQHVIVTCGWEKIDGQNNLIQLGLPKNLGSFFNNITLNFLAGSLLLEKSLFIEIGGFDISLPSGQHTDLLLRLLPHIEEKKIKIMVVPHSLIKIYIHSFINIRSDYSALYNGTWLLLKKHKSHFNCHKKEYRDYLNVAALSAFKTGRIIEAKKLFREAFLVKPFNFKTVSRLILIELPILRNYIWK